MGKSVYAKEEDDESVSTAERKSCTVWLAKTEHVRFQEICDENGTTQQALFRKFVKDYIAGRYLNVAGLSSEAQQALETKRAELGVRGFQPVVEIVLNEWA